ncbi:hypothetical protein CTZ27_11515 [Streptomyces griseocarneus]|nr:hypothetical protein CTZ27_11515 [Streptomyces griseocarneus]
MLVSPAEDGPALQRAHGGDVLPRLLLASDITALTRRIIDLDVKVGARRAARTATRILQEVERRPRPEGSEASAALAELFQVAAWTLFDAEHHAQARLLHRQALALSRRHADRAAVESVELLILSMMSMQEEHLGRPGQALRISSSVLARTDLPPRVRAIFHVREARAHARLRRRSPALRSLRQAEELFQDGPGAQDPQWAWWFDRTELLGHHGLALAALGDPEDAAAFLHEAALPAAGPAYRVLFATELTRVLARAGAWQETEACLSRLAGSVPSIGSARALASLSSALRHVERGRSVPRGLRDTARQVTQLLEHTTEPGQPARL